MSHSSQCAIQYDWPCNCGEEEKDAEITTLRERLAAVERERDDTLALLQTLSKASFERHKELTAANARIATLELALETENGAATRYAQQCAHWIEKYDAAKVDIREVEHDLKVARAELEAELEANVDDCEFPELREALDQVDNEPVLPGSQRHLQIITRVVLETAKAVLAMAEKVKIGNRDAGN